MKRVNQRAVILGVSCLALLAMGPWSSAQATEATQQHKVSSEAAAVLEAGNLLLGIPGEQSEAYLATRKGVHMGMAQMGKAFTHVAKVAGAKLTQFMSVPESSRKTWKGNSVESATAFARHYRSSALGQLANRSAHAVKSMLSRGNKVRGNKGAAQKAW